MNKRQRKKKLNQLTGEERTVIELYRACYDVMFYLHDASTEEAKQFVSLVGEPQAKGEGNTKWFRCEKDKITAVSFLKQKN